MSDDVFIKSKTQEKRELREAERQHYLKEQREYQRTAPIIKRWEEAQIQAATWQSVLDHAIQIYQEHKEELEEDIIKQTEEQIQARQTQIKDFLMTEKDIYVEAMKVMED